MNRVGNLDHGVAGGLENVLTRNGIWATGLLGLAAIAAFCLMHHAPSPNVPLVSAPVVKLEAPQAPKIAAPATPAATTPTTLAPSATPSISAPSASASTVVLPAVAQKRVGSAVLKSATSSKPSFAVKKKKRMSKQMIAQRKLQQAKAIAKAKARKQLAMKRSIKKPTFASCDVRQPATAIRSICFAFNSANLSAVSKARLDKVAPVLIQNKAARYELAGYADRLGNTDYNAGLAKRRASTVQSYLVSQGVSADQISAKGYGAERGSSFSQHRRVDVKVVQP